MAARSYKNRPKNLGSNVKTNVVSVGVRISNLAADGKLAEIVCLNDIRTKINHATETN